MLNSAKKMSSPRFWLSFNKLFNLVFLLSFFQSSSLHAKPCTQEQSFVLLHFKRQFSFNKSASEGCHSYPKLESWKEATECCTWDGIECDDEAGQIIGLDLSCSWLQGTIHPNSSLFQHFPQLQRLNLAFNDFAMSPISPAFGVLTRLTHLNLSSSNFFGKVPLEVSFLTKLISVDLSNNHLKLENHEFELIFKNLSGMRELMLKSINLSLLDLNSLLNLTSLEHLDLRFCGLQGKFPDGMFHLSKLKELHIGYNDGLTGHFPKSINSSSQFQLMLLPFTSFNGKMPESIGNLKSLKKMVVRACYLNESIPASLGNLTQLTRLDLSFNDFAGFVPSSLSNLRELIYLDLSGNHLKGTVESFLPSSENLAHLKLYLNRFSGSFPTMAANLTGIVYVDLWHNHLKGPLPLHMAGLQNLILLNLGGNHINGTIPHWIFQLPKLAFLYLYHNELIGHISQFQSSLLGIDLSYNNFQGSIPSSIFHKNLLLLCLSSNYFSGNLDPNMLCKATSLEILYLSHNNFSGEIPKCLGNFASLSVFDLKKNNFSGTIPDTFARGNMLTAICLYGNRLEGRVPRSLVNCRELVVLDLGTNKLNDTFPRFLGKLPKLQILILGSNRFQGAIMSSKAELRFAKLLILDISQNDFRGLLPANYFENFRATMNTKHEAEYIMYYSAKGNYFYFDYLSETIKGLATEVTDILTIFSFLDCSQNNFEGEIPNSIGKLRSLQGLNFSHNNLTGHIPTSFQNLKMLEWLDLSSNKLVGNIPQQLTNLLFLEVLNLSENLLIGPIPQGNQFNTFSNESYSGNTGLCGPPLSNKCSNSRATKMPLLTPQQEDDLETHGKSKWGIILVGYSCGLVVGLVMGFFAIPTRKLVWILRFIKELKLSSY